MKTCATWRIERRPIERPTAPAIPFRKFVMFDNGLELEIKVGLYNDFFVFEDKNHYYILEINDGMGYIGCNKYTRQDLSFVDSVSYVGSALKRVWPNQDPFSLSSLAIAKTLAQILNQKGTQP